MALCIVGGAVVYSLKTDENPSLTSIAVPLGQSGDRTGIDAGRDVAGVSAPVSEQPPPPPPPALVQVDSYAATNLHLLSDWPQVPGAYGYMDTSAIGGDNPRPLSARALTNDDVLTVSGWAGHQILGMTMQHVLFSMCGQIVGHVVVNSPRPDVAKAVHPYLGQSGWRAQLAVAHLPRCEKATLSAFGLAAKGPNLWPLSQTIPLVLPPKDEAQVMRFASRAPGLDAWSRPTPQAQNVKIRASALRVRSCGSSQCGVLGKVSKGVYKGYVVERRDGWALIQLPHVSGWLSEKHIQLDG